MKKTIITLTIISSLSSLSIAKEYFSVIKQTKNSYESEKLLIETEKSEWVNTDEEVCIADIKETDFYYNKEFTQTKDCSTNQERTLKEYRVYNSGFKELLSTEKEYQIIERIEEETLYGSHIENNCKEIMDNGYSVGDGEYFISFNGGISVVCDMTRSGGGWTQLSDYDFNEDSDNIPDGLVKAVDKVVTNGGVQYQIKDGWYTVDTPSKETSYFNDYHITEVSISSNGMNWVQTMIDIDSRQERSLDSFNVILDSYNPDSNFDVKTIEGQYVDGLSLTYGDINDRKHLLTMVRSGVDSNRIEWINNEDDDVFNDYTETRELSGDEAYVSGIKNSSSEQISVRLMSDQRYSDEMVGLTKLKVWIK